MRRIAILFAMTMTMTLSVALTAGTAQAGWSEFWHRFKLDWHRVNCWPEPFVHADRELAVLPFLAMVDSGWRLENTLGNHLFDHQQHLTHAGELKVYWIATQAPVHRRMLFVLRARDAEQTAQRVEAVQEAVTRIAPQGPPPEVVLTDIEPPRGSGDYFDQIDRKGKSSIPPPRLPARETTNGGN